VRLAVSNLFGRVRLLGRCCTPSRDSETNLLIYRDQRMSLLGCASTNCAQIDWHRNAGQIVDGILQSYIDSITAHERSSGFISGYSSYVQHCGCGSDCEMSVRALSIPSHAEVSTDSWRPVLEALIFSIAGAKLDCMSLRTQWHLCCIGLQCHNTLGIFHWGDTTQGNVEGVKAKLKFNSNRI
jgi:hypothetical protein